MDFDKGANIRERIVFSSESAETTGQPRRQWGRRPKKFVLSQKLSSYVPLTLLRKMEWGVESILYICWCKSKWLENLEESNYNIFKFTNTGVKESWVIANYFHEMRDYLKKPAWVHNYEQQFYWDELGDPILRIWLLSFELWTHFHCALALLWSS